ncbi:MAG: TolC family protein [Rhizobiaceae bacterium]
MQPIVRNGVIAAIASLLLAGCAAFSPDGGMSFVVDTAGHELRKEVAAIRTEEDASASREAVARLLKRPLTADAAVQIALLNNRGLQAAYSELGIAEARMVAASLPPNPTLSVSRLAGAGSVELEGKLLGDILALATLPARSETARKRFRQAQLRAAEETLRLAQEARRAWYQAVASQQLVGYLGQAKTAADTASKLSERLGGTGAINKLDQTRQQTFYAETTAQLATARQTAASDRERLIRAMGLWGRDLNFRLPSTLPALPGRPLVQPAIEREAIKRRLDVQVARLETEALAGTLGLTQATRFLDVLELAGLGKRTKTGDEIERERGLEVELRVPLFDFGESRVRQAEQSYMQAINRLAEIAVNARSQARDAYRSYRASYDIAGHYQREILPLRQIISDEMLLRYNAMQIDVFALLTEARQRIAANTAAIEAQRNFWLATTTLSAAVIGGMPGAGASSPAMAVAAGGGEAGGH